MTTLIEGEMGPKPKYAYEVDRLKYSHDALIDLVIASPRANARQLAEHFGYSPQWVRQIMASDAFQARLMERKKEIVDPTLVATVEERLRGLADLSAEILTERLEVTRSADLALKALEVSSKALGYGARKENVNIQNNFVVPMPPVAKTAKEWAESYTPGGKPGGGAEGPGGEVASSTPTPVTIDLVPSPRLQALAAKPKED